MIRVLVADASPFTANVIARSLQASARVRVVGITTNGEATLQIAHRLKPDAAVLDVNLPAVYGPLATRRILDHYPCRILVTAEPASPQENERAFLSLDEGALDIMARPSGVLEEGPPGFARSLLSRIEGALRAQPRSPPPCGEEAQDPPPLPQSSRPPLVLIGGGLGAVPVATRLLRRISDDFRGSFCVVQRLEPGFQDGYGRWLSQETGLEVEVCRGDRNIEPRRVYLAPDDAHLVLKGPETLGARKGKPVAGSRPSLTALFRSAARHRQGPVCGVLLSGCGSDGVEGLKALRRVGAVVLAQARSSCVIPELSERALAAAAVDREFGPDELLTRMVLETGAGRGVAKSA